MFGGRSHARASLDPLRKRRYKVKPSEVPNEWFDGAHIEEQVPSSSSPQVNCTDFRRFNQRGGSMSDRASEER